MLLIVINRLTSHSELAKKRHELIEMRCDERKLTKQSEMIKFAINELGCEELPSGCELPIEGSLPLNQDDEVCNNYKFSDKIRHRICSTLIT